MSGWSKRMPTGICDAKGNPDKCVQQTRALIRISTKSAMLLFCFYKMVNYVASNPVSMLRNALSLLILVLLALGVVDAKMPQVGDQVYIATSSSNPNNNGYQGEITDIGNGLICLKCNSDSHNGLDTCIGIGSIVSLTWV